MGELGCSRSSGKDVPDGRARDDGRQSRDSSQGSEGTGGALPLGRSNRLRDALSLPAAWFGLAISSMMLWYLFALRSGSPRPVSLPIPLMGHPRSDVAWLSALLAIALTSLVALGLAEASARRGRGNAWDAAPSSRPSATEVAFMALCVTGTALVQLQRGAIGFVAASGAVAGVGFAALACRASRTTAWDAGAEDLQAAGKVCLVAALVASLLLSAVGCIAQRVLVCLLPVAFVACLSRMRALASRERGGAGAQAAGPARSSGSLPGGGEPVADASRRAVSRSHLTVLVFCVMGVGLLMGVAGFGEAAAEPRAGVGRLALASACGSALCLALLAASTRTNHDGPYVLLPVLLGTSALVLLLPVIVGSGISRPLVMVAGSVTDQFSFILASWTLIEFSLRSASGQGALADEGRAVRGSGAGEVVVAACAAALLAGLLLGGVLVSAVGTGVVTVVAAAVSLVYGALLGLGLSVGQRGGAPYVVVSNPEDMSSIAQAQARELAARLGNLTPREREILPLLLQHKSADAIAEKMGISRNTVKSHTAHIYEKAGVNTRQQLVDCAASMPVDHLRRG